jgi:hypothetical protein
MDLTGLQQFIDSELLYALRLGEEREILSGNGAANGQMPGLLPSAIPYDVKQTVAGDPPSTFWHMRGLSYSLPM